MTSVPTDPPKLVFCKNVIRTLKSYGYGVSVVTETLASTHQKDGWFLKNLRLELIKEVGNAVRHLEKKNEGQVALDLLTEITGFLTPEHPDCYCELMYALRDEYHVQSLFLQSDNVNHAYAFSVLFLMLIPKFETRYELSAIISNFTGTPFMLSDDVFQWNDEFTLAMFGPLWHSLYMCSETDVADIIQHFIHERPPVMGRNGGKVAVGATLPCEIDQPEH